MIRPLIASILALLVLTALTVWSLEHRESERQKTLFVELQAADAVRAGIERYRSAFHEREHSAKPLDFSDLEKLVNQLFEAKCIEKSAARYVLVHPRRFAVRREDAGMTVEARWIFDDSAL